MKLRSLGLRAIELEAGPYRFLLLDCIPVAYRDASTGIEKVYRSSQYFRKGVTKAVNKWLGGREAQGVAQDQVVAAFQGISRFGPEYSSERRREGRRSDDQVPESVQELAQALVKVLRG